ncbi:hypothetical protein NP493_93g04040 [Ridgeia piscesae]|uniref:Uncharacterized protein n=1 Tax=Ridgeia piscesae TaxID=27915 RepID=A0AAD9P868_RIDPI|nr:hypothetical protein NP493_93g04040 [Ridgeia piscesae]
MVSANGRGQASCLHREVGYKLSEGDVCPTYRVCTGKWTMKMERCPRDDDCMSQQYQRCLPKDVIRRLENCY